MMTLKKIFLFTFLIIILQGSLLALEIDEKITARLLSLSRSKKTALINRGLEDGIVVGQHAKFFLTKGVIARGVVIKASPTRSIWSIYRMVDPDKVVKGQALSLKIATPIKLTNDSSRSLKVEATVSGSEEIGIKLAEGADDRPESLSLEDRGDLDALNGRDRAIPSDNLMMGRRKSWKGSLEAFGLFYFSSLNGTFDDGATDTTGTINNSVVNISAGGEYYFSKSKNFLNKFSLMALVGKRSITTGENIATTNDWFEYGVGINWHFLSPPTAYNRFIGFLTGSIGIGSVTVSSENDLTNTEALSGSSKFLSVGIGIKYYLVKGLGFRAQADFFNSSETFQFDDDTTKTRSLSGPRLLMGLSYRF